MAKNVQQANVNDKDIAFFITKYFTRKNLAK